MKIGPHRCGFRLTPNISAGVPQVVLPVWMDTFDFARRAEILEIGRRGNQSTEYRICTRKELGSALVDVLMGGRWSVYESRAKELAALCKLSGGGRVIAAKQILAQIKGEHESDASENEKESVHLLSGNGHC